MTDGISINQFRTQIDQQSTNLDAKVKLDGDGGLKTFGKSFLGKVACWFQKSSSRKAQSNEVRNSFVSALRKEYGSNETVTNVLDGIRGNKRLSLRTAQQALNQLDSNRNSFMTRAFSLYQENMVENGVSQQIKNIGYEQGSLDQDQLIEMQGEIAKSLARIGNTITDTVARSTAKEVIMGYMAKNLPINTVEDAVKILSNTPTKDMDDAVQRVFDHFKGQEGGMQKLQDCSLQLMGLEIDGTTEGGTLLRSNSTASKLIGKTLNHMTEIQNNDLVQNVIGLIPEEVPAPVIDTNTGEKNYTANSSQFNNPEFFTLGEQLSISMLNELQNNWAQNISNETKSFLNGIMTTANERGSHLGEGVGEKTLAAVLMLRLINPAFTGKEVITQINDQIKELNSSNNPNKEQLINSLNGKLKAIVYMTKSLQFIANTVGMEDPVSSLTNSGKVPQAMLPFVTTHLDEFNNLLESVSEI